MIAEYKPLTKFRASLTSICRAVQAGKKEVIVTFHQQPVDFLDAIERYDAVILTARNKRLVRCEKI